jgi:hypothetical protein
MSDSEHGCSHAIALGERNESKLARRSQFIFISESNTTPPASRNETVMT